MTWSDANLWSVAVEQVDPIQGDGGFLGVRIAIDSLEDQDRGGVYSAQAFHRLLDVLLGYDALATRNPVGNSVQSVL